MKRSYIIMGVIALLVIILFFAYRGTYNTAINLQEKVDETWGNVNSAYQRRADLVPELVNTVKGAAANEKEILTKVT
ncbi:MAG: LemA family protein, partial [Flavobacteriia bacterium]